MPVRKKFKRGRSATQEKILDAVEQLIVSQGFSSLGVNAIAEKAGVSKILIYRYFNGIDGLIAAFVLSGRLNTIFKPERLAELVSMKSEDRGEIWARRLAGVARELRQKKAMKAMLLWELSANNDLLTRFTKTRNEQLSKMIAASATRKEIDTAAITAILSAGIVYLALAEDKRKKYADLDLTKDDTWHRIEKALEFIYKAINHEIGETG